MTPGAPAAPTVADALGTYVTGEDHLKITSFGSASGCIVAVRGRFTRCDGTIVPITETHTPNSDRTPASNIYPLDEGWISNLEVFASSASPRRGQVFVLVEIVRGITSGALSLATLVQGYITDTSRRAWPGMINEQMPDRRGFIRSITGTDPAANTEWSETVPTNARWRLIGVSVVLVTDANVANRQANLIIDDGANILHAACHSGNITASLTTRISYGAVGFAAGPNSVAFQASIPPDLILMGGYRVRSSTTSIQATDNYGAPQLHVEEWIED